MGYYTYGSRANNRSSQSAERARKSQGTFTFAMPDGSTKHKSFTAVSTKQLYYLAEQYRKEIGATSKTIT